MGMSMTMTASQPAMERRTNPMGPMDIVYSRVFSFLIFVVGFSHFIFWASSSHHRMPHYLPDHVEWCFWLFRFHNRRRRFRTQRRVKFIKFHFSSGTAFSIFNDSSESDGNGKWVNGSHFTAQSPQCPRNTHEKCDLFLILCESACDDALHKWMDTEKSCPILFGSSDAPQQRNNDA